MTIAESAVNDALKSEDIESLLEAGAPEDEYLSEARSIMKALAILDEPLIAEARLTDIIRSVWARSFGLSVDDLEMRMPAFRSIAHKILG